MAITSNATAITFDDNTIQTTAGKTGTVTSVATGNGLSGGTITSSGTLVIAAPSAGSVGSYVLGGGQNAGGIGGSTFTFDFNQNYAAGVSSNQVSVAVITDIGYSFNTLISGTWKWLSRDATTVAGSPSLIVGLIVRVA